MNWVLYTEHKRNYIHLDPNAQPKFHQPRNVPYAIHGRVEQALARLEKHGVIEPVNSADRATPIVPVMKKDGTIWVCGDYKVTVNQAATVDTYPLPLIDDLFSSLAGGTNFSKPDLAMPTSKWYSTRMQRTW